MNILYIVLASLFLFFILGHVTRCKRARNKVIHIVDDNCARCRCCLKKCHRGVLEMVADGEGGHITVKSPERCTACGDCVAACKFNALELIDRKR